MVKTTDLVADLRTCLRGECSTCGHECGNADCLDRIMEDAADRLEELVDRCARYAEEIAVLREKLPAADVVPVVHGRWEWLGPNRLVTDCMCGTCSACKVRSKYIVNTMLCPNCGAKMDGGNNDATDGNV